MGVEALMTRHADPKAKTQRLILNAKPEQEHKIRAFRELCARNQLSISDILFEKVEQFLKEHNWPPGNSQTILPIFQPTGIGSRPQIFKAQIKIPKKFLGRMIEEDRPIQVTEVELQKVLKEWPLLDDKGKQSWLKILAQIDHPIAHKILEEVKRGNE